MKDVDLTIEVNRLVDGGGVINRMDVSNAGDDGSDPNAPAEVYDEIEFCDKSLHNHEMGAPHR